MRIAMFTDTFLPSVNGIVTSIVNSTKGLAKKGHKIIIFTSSNIENKHIHLGKNITVKHYKTMNLIKYPDFKLAMPSVNIIKEISRFKPNVIHSHQPSFLGWEAVICSKMFKIPIISTYHTFLPDFMGHTGIPKYMSESETSKRFAWSYTRGYYNVCDLVITPSHALKEVLIKEGIRKPIHALSNGVDLKKFKPMKKRRLTKTILHVGRISHEKQIDILINAFRLVNKKAPDWKLKIVGGGPDLSSMKKYAGKLLHQSIEFTGPISHEKLEEVYNHADIFATASTIETEGLVILEAMACGLPVVGVNRLAIPNIVKHGENGFIASAHNHKQIADYLIRLINDPKLRKKFKESAVKNVKKYSTRHTIRTLEKIYSSESAKKK